MNEVILPFDSEEFREAWNDFLAYRKEQHNFVYKGTRGKNAVLNRLKRFSHNDEAIAIAILRKAMSYGWRGVFALDKGDPLLKNRGTSAAEIMLKKHGINYTR